MPDLFAGERISYAEKARCAEREVQKRRSVYPRLVAQGKMSQERADREIATMAEIAADYFRCDEIAKSGRDRLNGLR